MDPPLVNEASFSTANPASYSLTGIWPFPPISGDAVGGGLGLRIGNLSGGAGDLDLSVEESTVTEQSIGNCRKRRDFSSEDESSKLVSTSSSANQLNNSNSKRMKASESGSGNGNSKAEEAADKKPTEQSSKSSEEPPKQDYIHVRARRGQATDSHSLAERARREKISERMKMLQDLVPGCNKVVGKALVLDEIINYVQSLQHQVEFLSMKLEAVNSRMNVYPAVDGFHTKDVGAPFDATGMIFGPQPSRDYAHTLQPEWLHMQIGGNFRRTA